MATGDLDDFFGRLQAVLPAGWFPNQADGEDGPAGAPIIGGLLAPWASVATFIYGLLAYIKLQTRIKTATDGWLDIIAYDFFGLRVQRAPAQSDASFRTTIVTEIFRPRNTRDAVIAILTELTGRTPLVFNGWREAPSLNRTAYYGRSLYGSRGTPFQSFVTAYRGNGVSDAQIYAAVASVESAGVILWTQIKD